MKFPHLVYPSAPLLITLSLCTTLVSCSNTKISEDKQATLKHSTLPAQTMPHSITPRLVTKTVTPIARVSHAMVSTTAITPNITAQDTLDILVFKVPELSAKNITVEDSGIISLPYIGSLNVMGLSLQQAEKRIATLLKKDALQDPRVTIKRTARKLKRNTLTVEGAVRTPGVFPFPIKGNLTFLQAIALSQGLTELADTKNIVVFRHGKQYAVNIDNIRRGVTPDPMLTADDRIVILKSDKKVTEKKILEYLPAVLAPLSLIL
ncbi:MAG: polysaccharide export protein [Cocleimonas sp.]|nr:polysaccharide export protein [Cocleimonas sp.]